MKDKIRGWLHLFKKWFTKKKVFAILCAILVGGGLVGFGFGLYAFSENYSSIYHYPKDEGGNFDCSSYNTWDQQTGICLSDDAYFYHNRWAVTDHDLANPDGVINAKRGWAQYGYEKKAYTTLKWHFTGLRPETEPKFRVVTELGLAYRVFSDDGCLGAPELFYSWGEPSKTDQWQYPGIYIWDYNFKTVTHDTLDVYVELSLSAFGGFTGYGLWLQNFDDPNFSVYGTAGAIAVILMICTSTALLASSKDRKLAWPFFLLSL